MLAQMYEDEAIINKISEIEDWYWWYAGRRRIIIKALSLLKRERRQKVLNIGCGTGADNLGISPFAEVYGTDYSLASLRVSQQKYNTSYFLADATSLPIKNAIFGCAFCLDVLEHVKNPEFLLSEAKRVLVDGGSLILTVPAYQWMWTYRDELDGHFKRYIKSELKNLLQNSGFQVDIITYFNFFCFPLALLDFFLCNIKPASQRNIYDYPMLPKPINSFLTELFALERFLIPRPGMFFGKSLLCVCKKNNNL
ncbi:MAG: methyltransferase domain-containing protein [Candidatus Glassbacteria bacterium]